MRCKTRYSLTILLVLEMLYCDNNNIRKVWWDIYTKIEIGFSIYII